MSWRAPGVPLFGAGLIPIKSKNCLEFIWNEMKILVFLLSSFNFYLVVFKLYSWQMANLLVIWIKQTIIIFRPNFPWWWYNNAHTWHQIVQFYIFKRLWAVILFEAWTMSHKQCLEKETEKRINVTHDLTPC